jgi:hypothetical protein
MVLAEISDISLDINYANLFQHEAALDPQGMMHRVVGNEPVVVIDLSGMVNYAKLA